MNLFVPVCFGSCHSPVLHCASLLHITRHQIATIFVMHIFQEGSSSQQQRFIHWKEHERCRKFSNFWKNIPDDTVIMLLMLMMLSMIIFHPSRKMTGPTGRIGSWLQLQNMQEAFIAVQLLQQNEMRLREPSLY